MFRFVHFSDIHVHANGAGMRGADWFSKRLTGWINMKALRGRQFRDAVEVLRRLVDDMNAQRPNFLIFSGDATSLGMEAEFALASEVLRVNDVSGPPALAVPGNHDYYNLRTVNAGLFERYFQPWLVGERLDDHVYPFGRQAGPFYLIGVNSCSPNRFSWDATGYVGADQLRRLRALLSQPHVQRMPKVLVTHYPITLANGKPERRFRRLRDLPDLLQIAREFGIHLWLHGHRHLPYYVARSEHQPIPSLCVGSGTQKNLWSYSIYTLDGQKLLVERRAFDPVLRQFSFVSHTEIPLALGDRTSELSGSLEPDGKFANTVPVLPP